MWKITAKGKKHYRGDAGQYQGSKLERALFLYSTSLSLLTLVVADSRDVLGESQPQHYRAERFWERNGVIPT